MYAIGYPLNALILIVDGLLFAYTLVVLASVIISWLPVPRGHMAVRMLAQMTEPVYKRIRPYMPNLGGLDLTPLVVLLAITFIQSGILPVFRQFAHQLITSGYAAQ